jgi:hypothetical protein
MFEGRKISPSETQSLATRGDHAAAENLPTTRYIESMDRNPARHCAITSRHPASVTMATSVTSNAMQATRRIAM